jgi:AcrR family transcriptional regulator
MTNSKDSYHHGDLRHALVEQATIHVELVGGESFSLRETARMVGVSANAAYRHFADKSALLTAVAARGFDHLSQQMTEAIANVGRSFATSASYSDSGAQPLLPSPSSLAIARFQAVGRAYVEYALAHPQLFRVMFGRCGLSSMANEPSLVPKPSPYELLGHTLDGLVAVGLLVPEHRPGAELKAWTVVHGFATLILEGASSLQEPVHQTAVLSSLLDFAVTGLCAPSSSFRYREPTLSQSYKQPLQPADYASKKGKKKHKKKRKKS